MRGPAGAVALALLLCGATSAGRASPASASPSGPATRAHAAAGSAAAASAIFWGAWIGKQFTGTEAPFDMRAVTKFQRLVGGKGLSLIEFSAPFENCYQSPCVPYPFPTRTFETVRRYGAVPLFSWGSNAIPIRPSESRYSLQHVIDGDFDAYIRSWATAAARWGHPFFLRFDWEMNGRWYPWGWAANGNRPGDFVQAWRHVHRIFTSVGATNVSWVWCPNVDPYGVFGPLQVLYPGAAYVDWTCADAYNRNSPWASFSKLFGSTYTTIRKLAPNKPMLLAEVATTAHGGSKASWIASLFRDLSTRYRLVRGLTWFEKFASGFDWPIETSKASQRAFVRGISSPLYAKNVFASLPRGPIKPP
jgi:mannan endo-1,4-beta-mannosidase